MRVNGMGADIWKIHNTAGLKFGSRNSANKEPAGQK